MEADERVREAEERLALQAAELQRRESESQERVELERRRRQELEQATAIERQKYRIVSVFLWLSLSHTISMRLLCNLSFWHQVLD